METTSSKKQQQIPTKWLDAHGDYLYRYALVRVRDAAAAEDLVQETLLAAISASDSRKSSERTWLTAILKQQIVDYFRRVARTPDFQLSTNDEPDMFENNGPWQGHWREDYAPLSWPTNGLAHSPQFWATFDRCLSCLPQRMAIALTLREIDGLTTNQICEILDVNSSDLRRILHCGRAKLRQLLEAELIQPVVRICFRPRPIAVEVIGRRN